MRCPQCSAEQPGGVTVCGFCGAPMVESTALDAGLRGAGQAVEEVKPGRRWASIVACALIGGLAIGWLVQTGGREDATGEGEQVPVEALSAAAEATTGVDTWSDSTPATVAGEPSVVRGRQSDRMTVEGLEAFADELADLAADGRASELAARVDPRARYRLTMQDASERRELDGGKAELLAHWLAPWLAAERSGGLVDELIEPQSATIDADPRQGILVRRLEGGGDATSIRYSRGFLLPLAMRGALAPKETAALDLSPLTDPVVRCVATETLRVAATPLGPRVIAVERIGLCEP